MVAIGKVSFSANYLVGRIGGLKMFGKRTTGFGIFVPCLRQKRPFLDLGAPLVIGPKGRIFSAECFVIFVHVRKKKLGDLDRNCTGDSTTRIS